MIKLSTLLAIASAVIVLCGCGRTVAVCLPVSFDKAVVRIQGVVINSPECFPRWTNRKVSVIETPSARCDLTMSRGWTRATTKSSTKMFDEATIVFAPHGETQTVAVVTVLSRKAFDLYNKEERNSASEDEIAQQLCVLFKLD